MFSSYDRHLYIFFLTFCLFLLLLKVGCLHCSFSSFFGALIFSSSHLWNPAEPRSYGCKRCFTNLHLCACERACVCELPLLKMILIWGSSIIYRVRCFWSLSKQRRNSEITSALLKYSFVWLGCFSSIAALLFFPRALPVWCWVSCCSKVQQVKTRDN